MGSALEEPHWRKIVEKIKKMTYCAAKVIGRSYQELDARAREYGATFFEVPVERVAVFIVEDARPETVSKHGDGEPETWSARFRIGCEVDADEDPADQEQGDPESNDE
jgi:hypothetical protein